MDSILPNRNRHALKKTIQAFRATMVGVFCLLAFMQVSAQQIAVRGQVSDAQGALPGVTVKVKGNTNGTTTDSQGRYLINAPANGTLVFSFLGFVEQEVAVNNRTTIDVTLVRSTEALGEVVITALGIKREAKSLGYSTSTVNMEALADNRSTNVGNSLQGKFSGVNVSAAASGEGGSSKIRIRAQSSFGGDNSPLIVVNGVPINNVTNTGSARSDDGGGLQSINQDDIASMTILKGAGAAALYGFRAKDGVILITTKSGSQATGIGVEYTANFKTSTVLDYTDFQMEYGQGENQKRPATSDEAKGSGTWNFGEKFDGVLTPQFDGTMQPYVAHPGKVGKFYETGTTMSNTIALFGGNDKGNFRASFDNTDAKNIMPNSYYHKKIFNVGLNHNFTQKLSLQLNGNYSKEYNKNPPQFSVESFSPNTTLYLMSNSIDVDWVKNYYKDANGVEAQLSRFPEWTNPYWVTNMRFENIKRDRLIGNLAVRYQFNDWIYAQGRIGQDYFSRNYDYNRPTFSGTLSKPVTGFNGSFTQEKSSFRESNLDLIVGLKRSFGSLGVDVTVGGNQMDQINDALNTAVTNFYVMPLYTIANGQTKNPNYSYSRKKVNSVFGSAEFSYKSYLYLNVTARNDWFSTLNPQSNSYLYPSVSTSFIFSDALKFSPAWLDYGKLRASYAEVGSDTNPYSQSLYYALATNPFNTSGLGTSGSTNPNPDLRPLKVKETEVGLELQMFKAAVKLDVAAYRKNTIDEILNVDISQSSGYNQTVVNVGKLRNQGIEMSLGFRKGKGAVTWETGFNGSYNISKILQLANDQTVFNVGNGPWYGWVSQQLGKPLASLRGYDYKRDAQGRILTTNGKFLQGNIINYGSGIYKWVGGWTTAVNYKKFKLATQVDFKAGAKLLSNSNMNFYRTGQHKATLVGREGGVVFPGYNVDGTPNTVAVPAEEFYTVYRSTLVATPFIYDASFVKWRTLSLDYDLSSSFNRTFIKAVTIGANVYNVLMIKKFVDNLDPEAQGSVSDNLAGMEVHTLPTTRNFTLNLNVKF